MKKVIDKGYYLYDKNGNIFTYVATQECVEYESDDEIIDTLFCGIKDEPCDTTVTMVNLDKRTSVVCDDVCELFGGPPTRIEIFKSKLKFMLFKAKVSLKKNFHEHIWYTKTWYEALVENNELVGWAHVEKVKIFNRWYTIKVTKLDYGNTEK